MHVTPKAMASDNGRGRRPVSLDRLVRHRGGLSAPRVAGHRDADAKADVLLVGVSYLGLTGAVVGTALLAKGLTEVSVISRAEGLFIAGLAPFAVGGYAVLGETVTASLPPLIFGLTLILGPLGVAWIVIGYHASASLSTEASRLAPAVARTE